MEYEKISMGAGRDFLSKLAKILSIGLPSRSRSSNFKAKRKTVKLKTDEKSIDRIIARLRRETRRALGLHYEYTAEELKNELRQRKFPKRLASRLANVLVVWKDIEYEDRKLTQSEAIKISEEAGKLLSLLEKRNRKAK